MEIVIDFCHSPLYVEYRCGRVSLSTEAPLLPAANAVQRTRDGFKAAMDKRLRGYQQHQILQDTQHDYHRKQYCNKTGS
jgi:hypothetical protein